MNKVFFDELRIPEPDYHLNVGSSSHGRQTGLMLERIENVLLKVQPDLVLVYGDCNTTLAGALAASKLHIKVGHIEAGLRSYDRSMPEEINRVLTDHCSDLLFCPTQRSVDNLRNENITEGVFLTGDVMVDALYINKKIAEQSTILQKLNLKKKGYLVVTLHRASNTDTIESLRNIVEALCEIKDTIVFPVHPRTENFLRKYNLFDKLKKQIIVLKPLGYFDFLCLMNNAKKVLTDSGGIQKEAYILKIPCITLRDNTEWVETVDDNWNVIVGTGNNQVINMVDDFNPKNKQNYAFGDGTSSKKILEIIDRKIIMRL